MARSGWSCASADLGTAPVTGEFADDLPYWHKYGASAEDQPCGVEEVSHRTLADIAEKGEDGVWLSMPSSGLVDHAWFQKHLEYPLLLSVG